MIDIKVNLIIMYNNNKINFLGARVSYARKGTAQAVLGKVNPNTEKYSLCGPGCKSCNGGCKVID